MSISRRFFLQQASAVAGVTALQGVPAIDALRRLPKPPGDISLIQNGKSSYAIVILPDAPLAAQHGAQELQSYLQRMSGARLPIVTSDDVAAGRLPVGGGAGHLITLGGPLPKGSDPVLADDAFLLRTRGTQIEINGGGLRGTLYGCYSLLEDVLGVRWFTTDCTVIPSRSTVILPALNHQDAPAYEYRFPYWYEAFDRDWAIHNRCNSVADGCHTVTPSCPEYVVQRLDPSVGSAAHYGQGLFIHTFEWLIPPKKYPALWNGGSLCTSDPAAVDAAVATLSHLIAAQPDARLWSVSQPDAADGACNCARCQQLVADEGAQSGPLIHFVNAIADRLGPLYPNILIDTLAYHWSEAPPRKVRPRDNVCIRFAPISACVAHAMGTCEKNRDAYANFVGWSKITKHLYVWNYVTNFTHFLQPLPNLTSLCTDVATFHRFGGAGLFSEGYYKPGGGGSFGELKAYLVAKLTWNPAQDGRALIGEYLRGVYGAGAPYIQQWLDAIEAEVRPGDGHGERHAISFDPVTVDYISDSLIARGVALFDVAEHVTAGNAATLDQVRKARVSVTYLQMLHSAAGSADHARYVVTLTEEAGRYHIQNPRD